MGPSLSRDGREFKGKVRARFDGFTPAKRKRFFATLRKTGCVRDGCRVAGISSVTVGRWRDKDAEFARQFQIAIDKAASDIETLAWERAVTGIEEPVIHYGKHVGTRIRRSDSIFRMILQGSNRKKYGRMGSAKQIAKEERKRIERKVRAKILAEQPSDEEVCRELTKRLSAFSVRLQQEDERGGEPDVER